MRKGIKTLSDMRPLVAPDKDALSPSLLLGAVDGYIEAVCDAGTYARDCGSTERIAKLKKALAFAEEVYNYLGVTKI